MSGHFYTICLFCFYVKKSYIFFILSSTIVHRYHFTTHNSLLADWGLYDTAESETGLFILWADDDIWLSELLKGMPTYYSEVFAKTMLDLQELSLGNHKVNILFLMENMRKMHHVFETTPKYISALEKEQNQAGRAEMTIEDANLFMTATNAMLETERYPKEDDVWEDLSKKERKW